MKKFIATITLLTVAVLPLATAGSATAAPTKFSVSTSIGGYCC
jgi:hypothetical protein